MGELDFPFSFAIGAGEGPLFIKSVFETLKIHKSCMDGRFFAKRRSDSQICDSFHRPVFEKVADSSGKSYPVRDGSGRAMEERTIERSIEWQHNNQFVSR